MKTQPTLHTKYCHKLSLLMYTTKTVFNKNYTKVIHTRNINEEKNNTTLNQENTHSLSLSLQIYNSRAIVGLV